MPRGLAIVADKRNLGEVEHQKRVVAHRRERAVKAANSAAEKLSAVRLTIKARAGEEGKLFGSVTNIDLERALADQGFTIERRRSGSTIRSRRSASTKWRSTWASVSTRT